MMQRLPHHLVQISPWPLLGSLSVGGLMASTLYWFNLASMTFTLVPLLTSYLIFLSWWRDVSREATFCGFHTSLIQQALSWGMLMFIASEVMFFSAFFWTFYHSSLAPTSEMGMSWPPSYLTPINPFSVPLLNTFVLLGSGMTVTWAHNSLIKGEAIGVMLSLTLTITLGLYFTLLQTQEYKLALFSMIDSVFGSTFYVATGFHGMHVIVGSIFLIITLIRITADHFSKEHHFGFEAAAWYWHFVDVVWLFLFVNLYWLSSP